MPKKSPKKSLTLPPMMIAYITVNNPKEGAYLGKYLVELGLAACTNLLPKMQSCYRWKGKIEMATESVLIVKTTRAHKNKLLKVIRAKHSYTVPCVLFFEIKGGNPDYLNWLALNVKSPVK